jgi:ribokinase
MKKICVIGSINMDLVASVERFPKPGETITGKAFGNYPGGKGANQVVAAGRLGGDVRIIGKVGDDIYGHQYLSIFEDNFVKSDGVGVEQGISTGIAVIEVDASGENHIIVIPGTNGLVDKQYIDKQYEYINECDIFLFQLEIPLDTVLYAMKRLKENDKTVILDPAPAKVLPDEIYKYVDFITPNETEIQILTGATIEDENGLKQAADLLLNKGVNTVIAKVGKMGAYVINKNEIKHVPGYKVNAVDTTAAGDSFNGGFAFSLSVGNNIEQSVKFANAVAALSTTAMGAHGAMPTFNQVQSFIKL